MARIIFFAIVVVFSLTSAAQQWEAVPLVSQKILNNGNSGGEGCQWPQAIEADRTDGSFLLFGTDVGGIYRSIDEGASWEPCNLGYNARGNCGFAIDPNNNRRALAVGANSIENKSHGLYLTEDQGATWKHVLPVTTYDGYRGYKDKIQFAESSFDSTSRSSLIAYWSCPSGGIYKSVDGGTSWNKQNEAFGDCVLKVHPDSGFIYVADDTGLYLSKDGGTTFHQKLSVAIRDMDVVKGDSTLLFAVTGTALYLSSDGGETFSKKIITGFTANLITLEVNPSNPFRMVVCNNEGEYNKPVYSSENGGNTWHKASFDHTNAFMPYNGRTHKFAWHPRDENKVWAFGGDWITSSSNGGKRFMWDANGYTGVLVGGMFNFNVTNPDLLYLASQDYNGAYTADGGNSWKYCNASGLGWGGFTYGAYAASEDVLVTQVSAGWHEPGVLTVSRNGGASFVKSSLVCTGLDSGCGDPKDSAVIYFSNYISKDMGVTWNPMEGCKGVLVANTFGKKEVYGANGNSVVKSSDGGDSWEQVVTLSQQVRDIAVDHVTDKLYIVTAGNRLFQFAGGQLADITSRIPADQYSGRSITTIAVDPNNPEIVYTAGPMNVYKTDAAVKRSTDGGQTWQVISPSERISAGSAGRDGANEVFALRVHPVTRELWTAGGCYGVWKFIPENKISVRILSPVEDEQSINPDSIAIKAEVYNPAADVQKVEFFSGNVKLGEDSLAPYEFKWMNPEKGDHNIWVKVTEVSGEVAYSPQALLQVLASRLPEVTITSPVPGSVFESHAPVEINVRAFDPDGTIGRLELYAGSQLLVEASDSLLKFIWEGMESGSYVLTARATDNTNQPVTSYPVLIIINAEQGRVEYSEDFNDSAAQGWESLSGEWAVVQNQYRSSSAGGTETSIYQGSTFYDYIYSLKLKSDWNNNLGAIFNYSDPDNYYLLELDADPQVAYLKMISGGIEALLAESSYTEGGAGIYMDVKIQNDGNATTVWVNDSIVFDEVSTTEFPYGKIGLYSWWNPIWIDNIRVSAKGSVVTEADNVIAMDVPVSIYPNPVTGSSFTVNAENLFSGNDVLVQVFNLEGKLLHSVSEAGKRFSISTLNFNKPGVYTITLSDTAKQYRSKIVIR